MGRKSQKNPSTKTLELIQANGWMGDFVERRITGNVTKDWCGWADIIAFHTETGIVAGIQATTSKHFAERLRKCLESEKCRKFVQAGHTAVIFAWRKNGTFRDFTIQVGHFVTYKSTGELPADTPKIKG